MKKDKENITKKVEITVETIPNGYLLTVDKNEYAYLSAKRLLKGMLMHVGAKHLQCLDNEQVDNLMEVIMSWPRVKDAAESQAKYLSKVKEAASSLISCRRDNTELLRKVETLTDMLNDANIKIKAYKKHIKEYIDLQDKYQSALSAMEKLDRRKARLEAENYEQAHEIAALKRSMADGRKSKKKKKESSTSTSGEKPKGKRGRSRKEADALILAEIEQNNS